MVGKMARKSDKDKGFALKILVVDDDPGIVDLTEIQLSSAGYKVFKAYDGVEGIQATFKHRPDLILLDVMMPRMDGFQVCRFLKNYPPYDKIPIIFLTVRKGIGDRQRGLLRGGDDYISKPLDLNELKEKIELIAMSKKKLGKNTSARQAVEKVKEFSDLTAILKLGELLDENLFKLTIMEEVTRAVSDAIDYEEILKLLLVGCISDIGLGFDRAIYMVKNDGGRKLVGHMALGAFPEAGVSRASWREVIKRVKDKTLREVYAQDMGAFPFISGEGHPSINELSVDIPNGLKIYDLTTTSYRGDIIRLSEEITSLASEKIGSMEVRAIPVVAKAQLVGVLIVDNSFCKEHVTMEDIKNLIILCNQIGLALERCRLLKDQNRWAKELERLSNLNLSIIQAAGVGIACLDPDGFIITWNNAMARLTGRETYKVLGRRIFDVFPNLSGSLVSRRLEKVLSTRVTERVGHYKLVLGRRTGYFDIKMSPVISRDTLHGVVLLLEDNTRRVKLENKHREVFQYLSSIIDHSADGIVTTDRRGRIRTWNPGAAAIFGYDEVDVKGRNIGILFPRGRSEEKSGILNKTAAGEVIEDHETILLSKLGERLYVSLTASPVRKADGNVNAASLFIRNITERKKLISQLFQTEKLASLGVMAAGMAHEINNPLTSILMYTQLITMTGELDPTTQGYLDKVAADVDRISEIVNDLLVYSRSRERELEKIDVNDILNQAVVFIKRKTATADLEIDLSIKEELPHFMGKANEILEIFLNILLNAADAVGKKGFIKVDAAVKKMRGDGSKKHRWLTVNIWDSGHGIPASKIPKIFDPFYTTKPPGKGTGLGLMVVSQLVEKYHGEIKVASKEGEGTKFSVYLPYGRINK